MIMDRLERFRCYQRSVPELWDAVRFAERVQKEQLPPGKYPVGKGFAFVQEGNTRSFEEADFELPAGRRRSPLFPEIQKGKSRHHRQ